MRLVELDVLVACSSKSPPAARDEPPAAPPAPAAADASVADASVPDASVPDALPDAAQPAAVACETDDDCWIGDDNQPMARPKSERGKKLRPCKDASRIPACKANVCTVVAYKC